MECKIITETELIEWMNKEFHKEEGFKDCKFTSVLRLADKDEDGCIDKSKIEKDWKYWDANGDGVSRKTNT